MQAAKTGGYIDFARFGALREQAHVDQAGTVDAIAEEFEALFVDLMLKAAREAELEGGLFDSSEMKTYREMLDQQMAVAMARNNDLGIGKVMARQFNTLLGSDGDRAQAATDVGLLAGTARAFTLPRVPGAAERAAAASMSTPSVSTTSISITSEADITANFERLATPDNPDASKNEFVADLAPYATAAAEHLGVSPRALVAQAALESGWGRHVIRHADGRSSHNYFGIKAGSGWTGGVVKVPTTEYINGRAVTVNAAFRAYPDAGGAFADYVKFISGNPRYEDVIANGASARRFATELAAAGYATDPNYANKIMAILDADDWSGPISTSPQVSN